jgi:hypothetical protein
MSAKRKSFLRLGLDDEEIMSNIYRTNTCRASDGVILYNLDFVPKLKPKLSMAVPSPMTLCFKSIPLYAEFDELKLDNKLQE